MITGPLLLALVLAANVLLATSLAHQGASSGLADKPSRSGIACFAIVALSLIAIHWVVSSERIGWGHALLTGILMGFTALMYRHWPPLTARQPKGPFGED